MGIKVLGRVNSINVRKVLWALDELESPYEREDWGLGFADAKSPQFLALNPNGQVPVFKDDGFVLWESNAILAYLGDKAPGAIMPTDPKQRGLVMQWLIWQIGELNPAWSYAVRALLRREPGFDDPARIEASVRDWNAKMTLLDSQLAQSGILIIGNSFTIADIALGLSVHRWKSVAFDKPVLANVDRYYEALLARPAGARHMAAATP